ncbi:MAG: MBL fold metallo-hydrolase [Clostridia bacterium]|nr:MBL fold metallo-hydrolase [Clostridia bacterium]
MAEKKKKSKEQQKRDLAKLAAAGAAAGYAAGKIAKGKKRGKKAKRRAAIVGFLMALIIVAVGAMYYFDIKPLDKILFDIKFKYWYDLTPGDFVQSDGNLQVVFLDVGQGDCILVRLPDGKNMLIDAGDKRSDNENHILQRLEEMGIDTIDYGVLTHTDADHVGGMDAVVESDITFKKMYMPLVKSDLPGDPVEGWYADAKASYLSDIAQDEPANFEIQTIETAAYRDFMTALIAEEGCEPIFSFSGLQIKTSEYVIDFYNPTYNEYDKISSAAEKNNVSPVMILKFNDRKIMFTGDCDSAEYNVTEAAVKTDKDAFDVDVLKVAHHGGKESTSEEFLSIVKPEYSVISVGEGNTYGHPTDEVLGRLEDVDSKVFTTMESGDIILSIKGSDMKWHFKEREREAA